MSRIDLKFVNHLPLELEGGTLYISEEFEIAGHLCPCGCGSKVITPLGINEWLFTVFDGKPTLEPSIGNWQLPCRSHYWICHGRIEWSWPWSDERIEAGRVAEEKQRIEYYSELEKTWKRKYSAWHRFKKWLSSILD